MILSDRLLRNLSQTNLKPIIVLQIEGVPTLYGSDTIKKQLLYGDPYVYGDPIVYGGLIPYGDQKRLISLEGTTTSIKQNLDPDKARSSGISQMSVKLIDKNLAATKLVSGQTWGEILFKKCKIWVSFGEDAKFNEDFILVFRGVIESFKSGQGFVTLNLNSPDQKKRQLLFAKTDLELDGGIDSTQTTITLNSVENLFTVPTHPLYPSGDPSLLTYVRIDDEIIQFTGISGLDLTGCIRGAQGTTAVLHDDEAQVESFYKLEGNAMDLALKVLLSNEDQSDYITNLPCTAVGSDGVNIVDNIFYFAGVDLTRDYNVSIGDYLTSTGFTETNNNLASYTEILDVVVIETGSYLLMDATLDYESMGTGTVSILSKYNTLGVGLGLDVDEIDIKRHEQLRGNFISNVDYRFFIREEIEDGKEFIEKEMYLPASCYSLPIDREGLARSSVGIHKPPLPGSNILTISRDNIIKPESLEVNRSVNKNYYNAVLFRYEDTPLDEQFTRKVFVLSGTQAVPTGNKPLVIDSTGLKKILNAPLLATQAANNLLDRYQNAAEFIQKVQINFRDGVQITVGDIIVLDPTGLNLINAQESNRDRPTKLMEVVNRDVDIKSGSVTLDLIDTSFNIDARYGLISASSKISTVITQKKFVITPILTGGKYGSAEYRKWINLKLPAVKIRTYDFSDVFETVLTKVNFNTVEVRDVVPFTLTGSEIMELAQYSNAETTDQQKVIYAYLSDGTNDFADGKTPYVFV